MLVPRPETETLVEAAVSLLPEGASVLDVGTGSGAVALALAHERPDLRITATDVSADALEVARANATRLGLDVEFVAADLLDGLGEDCDAVVSQPAVRRRRRRGTLPPEFALHEPAAALFAGADGLDVVRRLVAVGAATACGSWRSRSAPGRPIAVRALFGAGVVDRRAARPRRARAGGDGGAMITAADAETFERCMRVGGVAVFPADTVYGLACEPDDRAAVERLYALKGRRPDKPAAVMFFTLELALAALPGLGPRTRDALLALLPGAVTAAAAQPGAALPAGVRAGPARRSGCACPALDRALEPLRGCAGRCSSRARTRRAAPTRGAWRTSPRRSARAPTCSWTAASCPARPRRWWTSATTRPRAGGP